MEDNATYALYVVLQHPVVGHLAFLCYSRSHMKIHVKISKFKI
jgi:hypothetical protein